MSDQKPSLGAVRTVGRRQWIIAGSAALAAVALALRVRSGGKTTQLSAATTAPRTGGRMLVAFDGAAVSTFVLDPHNSGFAPHNRVLRSIYDNLTRLLPDQTVGPWLAESWQVSPDGTSYSFKLRRGVTFHDGTPFDAAALQANFDRLSKPQNTLSSRSSLGPYTGSEVVADDELRVTLSEPFAPFLRNLSMTKLAIVSPTAVAKYGASYAQNPVGTGPFRFVSLKQATEIQLERNPAYRWSGRPDGHTGPAHLETLTFLNVPEEATRVAVLLSGQVHAADLIPPQNLPAIKSDSRFALFEKELLNTNYSLALNVSRAPWDDEELRLAVRLSLDIESIVRVIYMGSLPRAWSSLSPSMFGSAERELKDSWQPDPARARAILERKGWKPAADGIREQAGKRLTIKFLDTQGNREKRLDVMNLIRRQLVASGISLTTETLPTGLYQAKLANNDFDLTAGASFHADPDILRQTYVPEVRPVLAGNRVVDPELIAWLKAGARESDGPARAEYYKKVQRKVLDKTYAIPIYVLVYNFAIAKRAHAITIDEHGFPEFHEAWVDT
jgi:peptide/nickel transport system substrate-binding protein